MKKTSPFKIAAGVFMETQSGGLFVMEVEMGRNIDEPSRFHVEDVVSPEQDFLIRISDEEPGEPTSRISITVYASEVDEFCQKLKGLKDMIKGGRK